jgi:hypothetical protein
MRPCSRPGAVSLPPGRTPGGPGRRRPLAAGCANVAVLRRAACRTPGSGRCRSRSSGHARPRLGCGPEAPTTW